MNIFNINLRINDQKQQKNIYHENLNANLMVGNVIQIRSGTAINADENEKIQKNVMRTKKIIFGILINAVAKMVNT